MFKLQILRKNKGTSNIKILFNNLIEINQQVM